MSYLPLIELSSHLQSGVDDVTGAAKNEQMARTSDASLVSSSSAPTPANKKTKVLIEEGTSYDAIADHKIKIQITPSEFQTETNLLKKLRTVY